MAERRTSEIKCVEECPLYSLVDSVPGRSCHRMLPENPWETENIFPFKSPVTGLRSYGGL